MHDDKKEEKKEEKKVVKAKAYGDPLVEFD
jgi:hypothetical protein